MTRSPEQIKQSLFALTTKGIKYDLERIAAAADRMGNPHDAYPSFHVAGTNGKGSTCCFIESVLRHAGYSTGLFTSPHIVNFEERFRINNVPVSEGEWVDVYHDRETMIADHNCTFFEATMLIGSELFRRRKVDWAVFETGLGGRLDATNILKPRVSVITRIAMDHREFLGNSLAEIAEEKLGIVKEGTPLVIADPGNPDIRRRVENVCRGKKAPVTFIASNGAVINRVGREGTGFEYRGAAFTTRLAGEFQVENALCAITAIERAGCGVDRSTLPKGIAATVIPGRFHHLRAAGKHVIIDVGHNPDAARVLCATLRRLFPGKKICFVVGIMADKEYPAMLGQYAVTARHLIVTRPDTGRAATVEMLIAHVPEGMSTICPDVAGAVAVALRREEEVVCITGSFYTVGEAMGSGLLK